MQAGQLDIASVQWHRSVRIVRSAFPPIDLFEDIADPADWPLLISAEQKTNPRLMESIGQLALIPPDRRVAGPGASYLMAPFTHVSPDRPSRFSTGNIGVLYVGNVFEVALFETIYHHARFMRMTNEPPGWTSQFREILVDIDASLHDLRSDASAHSSVLADVDYSASQVLSEQLRNMGSQGVVYPSVRYSQGECAALFYPDLASNAHAGRHLDCHWDGEQVDLYRDVSGGEVFRVG
jgi:hypothetical protein